MRQLFSFLTLLLLTTSLVDGQVQKCDGDILRRTSKKVGRLSEKEMSDFYMTFHSDCNNNVEYSEWSNELLFALLDKQTSLALRILEKEEKKIEMEEILEELSSPTTDAIDINDLTRKIDKVKFNSVLKTEILDRLRMAAGN